MMREWFTVLLKVLTEKKYWDIKTIKSFTIFTYKRKKDNEEGSIMHRSKLLKSKSYVF